MTGPSPTQSSPPRVVSAAVHVACVPFLVLATQIATGWPFGARSIGPALYALLLYGALLLSFRGGVTWGEARSSAAPPASRAYVLAVVPLLAAWASAWVGGRHGLLGLAAAFVLFHAAGRWQEHDRPLPPAHASYAALQMRLTAVAALSLPAAAFFGPF